MVAGTPGVYTDVWSHSLKNLLLFWENTLPKVFFVCLFVWARLELCVVFSGFKQPQRTKSINQTNKTNTKAEGTISNPLVCKDPQDHTARKCLVLYWLKLGQWDRIVEWKPSLYFSRMKNKARVNSFETAVSSLSQGPSLLVFQWETCLPWSACSWISAKW